MPHLKIRAGCSDLYFWCYTTAEGGKKLIQVITSTEQSYNHMGRHHPGGHPWMRKMAERDAELFRSSVSSGAAFQIRAAPHTGPADPKSHPPRLLACYHIPPRTAGP